MQFAARRPVEVLNVQVDGRCIWKFACARSGVVPCCFFDRIRGRSTAQLGVKTWDLALCAGDQQSRQVTRWHFRIFPHKVQRIVFNVFHTHQIFHSICHLVFNWFIKHFLCQDSLNQAKSMQFPRIAFTTPVHMLQVVRIFYKNDKLLAFLAFQLRWWGLCSPPKRFAAWRPVNFMFAMHQRTLPCEVSDRGWRSKLGCVGFRCQ